MNTAPQIKKALRKLQQESAWPMFEQFIHEYIKVNFTETSIKRNSEFETIWQAAYNEGGKAHLYQLLNELEQQALNADE